MKSRPPETLAQAQEWQRAKHRYESLGLCGRCAAQAAWGHQKQAGGWQGIHPPCGSCTHLVAELPHPTPNANWRKSLRCDGAA